MIELLRTYRGQFAAGTLLTDRQAANNIRLSRYENQDLATY